MVRKLENFIALLNEQVYNANAKKHWGDDLPIMENWNWNEAKLLTAKCINKRNLYSCMNLPYMHDIWKKSTKLYLLRTCRWSTSTVLHRHDTEDLIFAIQIKMLALGVEYPILNGLLTSGESMQSSIKKH